MLTQWISCGFFSDQNNFIIEVKCLFCKSFLTCLLNLRCIYCIRMLLLSGRINPGKGLLDSSLGMLTWKESCSSVRVGFFTPSTRVLHRSIYIVCLVCCNMADSLPHRTDTYLHTVPGATLTPMSGIHLFCLNRFSVD